MNATLFAIAPTEVPVLALRIAAAIFGALLGGFLIGLLGKVLFRRGWGVFLTRLGGAGAGGVLAWMFVAGGGLGSFGFGGGSGPGDRDSGPGRKDKQVEKTQKDDVKTPAKDTEKGPKESNLLQVAVLGDAPLRALFGELGIDINRCYRIEDGPANKVLTLKELQEELKKRQEKNSKLKVIVLIYKDSPTEENEIVRELIVWLGDYNLYMQTNQPSAKAPR